MECYLNLEQCRQQELGSNGPTPSIGNIYLLKSSLFISYKQMTVSQDKDIISILSAFSLTFLYAEKFTKFLLPLLNPSKEKQA
jgi:hypothetical protein